jgi:hypothetical protein
MSQQNLIGNKLGLADLDVKGKRVLMRYVGRISDDIFRRNYFPRYKISILIFQFVRLYRVAALPHLSWATLHPFLFFHFFANVRFDSPLWFLWVLNYSSEPFAVSDLLLYIS